MGNLGKTIGSAANAGVVGGLTSGVSGAITGGVGSVLGSIFGRKSSKQQQIEAERRQFEYWKQQQQILNDYEQRKYERNRSDSIDDILKFYQRQVASLQAGGLNPALAAGSVGAAQPLANDSQSVPSASAISTGTGADLMQADTAQQLSYSEMAQRWAQTKGYEKDNEIKDVDVRFKLMDKINTLAELKARTRKELGESSEAFQNADYLEKSLKLRLSILESDDQIKRLQIVGQDAQNSLIQAQKSFYNIQTTLGAAEADKVQLDVLFAIDSYITRLDLLGQELVNAVKQGKLTDAQACANFASAAQSYALAENTRQETRINSYLDNDEVRKYRANQIKYGANKLYYDTFQSMHNATLLGKEVKFQEVFLGLDLQQKRANLGLTDSQRALNKAKTAHETAATVKDVTQSALNVSKAAHETKKTFFTPF